MASFAFHLYVLLTCLAANGAFARLRTFNFTVHSAVRSPGLYPRCPMVTRNQMADDYRQTDFLVRSILSTVNSQAR